MSFKILNFPNLAGRNLNIPNLAGKILNFTHLVDKILNFLNLACKILIIPVLPPRFSWQDLEYYKFCQ